MRIITHTCPKCGTIVSATELEKNRVMNCPRIECDEIISFEDLAETDRAHYLENVSDYRL